MESASGQEPRSAATSEGECGHPSSSGNSLPALVVVRVGSIGPAETPVGLAAAGAAHPGLARLGTPAGSSWPLSLPNHPRHARTEVGLPHEVSQQAEVRKSRERCVLAPLLHGAGVGHSLSQNLVALAPSPSAGPKTSRPLDLSFTFKGNGGNHSVFTTEFRRVNSIKQVTKRKRKTRKKEGKKKQFSFTFRLVTTK